MLAITVIVRIGIVGLRAHLGIDWK